MEELELDELYAPYEREDRQYGGGKRGDELPLELSRRVTRRTKIREAKAALESNAQKEAQEERRERQTRETEAREEGHKPTASRWSP